MAVYAKYVVERIQIFVAYYLLDYYAVLLIERGSVTLESEPSTKSADFDPMFPDLGNFPGDGVFFRVFYRNVALLHLRAQRGKNDILSNNRRSKLHAVIDCLFISFNSYYLALL